jgi:hypothetical protein
MWTRLNKKNHGWSRQKVQRKSLANDTSLSEFIRWAQVGIWNINEGS